MSDLCTLGTDKLLSFQKYMPTGIIFVHSMTEIVGVGGDR